MTTESALAGNLPYNEEKLRIFRSLYKALQRENFPYMEDPNKTDAAYSNFAFFESYFSNYEKGTVFTLETALHIIDTKDATIYPSDNYHDILGTYRITSDRQEMCRTPKTYEEFIDILLSRHRRVMADRPERRPGKFKLLNNFAVDIHFVHPVQLEGTLRRAFEYYLALTSPVARAFYILAMVTETHPFMDDNGRMSRIMMNAELVSSGQSKIMIPTLIRAEYISSQRQYSKHYDPSAFISVMKRIRRFSARITGEDFYATRHYLESRNAFKSILELVNHKP